MAVVEDLTEDERYLFALLNDPSGIDLAEFCWTDPERETGCWRAWPFQWDWWHCDDKLVIDQCARSVGKSTSIKLKAFAFPFQHPKQEMVITAPELVHLNPIIGLVENQFMECRLGRAMLPSGKNHGITHRPFEMNFLNRARIFGRIPQRDGKGVKGIHPLVLELDEGQDFPEPGYIEVIETMKSGSEGASWRIHGVTRGVRDFFFKFTQPDSGWTVFRFCLPEGTLVYGVDGPVPIEEVEVGTRVWSVDPDGSLVQDEVTDTIENGVKDTWIVHAKGGFELETTPNHPYLILSRRGTKRTRKDLRFEWVEASEIQPGDYIIGVDHLDSTGVEMPHLGAVSEMLADYSPQRSVPEWVWRAPRSVQEAFLAGYLMGDGSLARQGRGQDPWQFTTASKKMAKELRALCHYLGLRPSALREKPNEALGKGPIWNFVAYGHRSGFRQIPKAYSNVLDGEMLQGLDKRLCARRVDRSEPSGRSVPTFDITVGDRHNYIAEGVVVHNTAMHRPDWTDQERREKTEMYGHRDHPDYRRNILGLHGDATSPLFVMSRLMACVDQDQMSEYNTTEYMSYRLRSEQLEDMGNDIASFLDFPRFHLKGKRKFWAGMDVGYTDHPSEIVVFAQEPAVGDKPSILRLVTRIHLERIGVGAQAEAIAHVIDFYDVQAFAMDKTGNGLPLFQLVQENYPKLADRVKGYNFSGNILVDFDETIEFDPDLDDEIAKRGIKRRVLEYASDKSRELVDAGRLRLPYDKELIGEFQGQTYVVTKSAMDAYGRKSYNKGSFHALDAVRMMVLAFVQNPIEELTKEKVEGPVLDLFFG